MMSKEEYAKVSRSMNIAAEMERDIVNAYNFMNGASFSENSFTLGSSKKMIASVINTTKTLINTLCEAQHYCTTFSTSDNLIGICLSDKLRKIFEENGYKNVDEIAYYINCKLLEEAASYIGSENDKKGSEKLSDVPHINPKVTTSDNANPIPGYPYPSNLFDPNVSMNYWSQFMRPMAMGEGNAKAPQQYMRPMAMGEGNNNAPQQYNPPKMKPEDMKKEVADKFKKNREAFNNEANAKA